LAIKYKVPAVCLLDQKDSRYRITQQERFNKPVHLRPRPDKTSLEASRFYWQLVVVAKSWHDYIATIKSPDQSFNIEIRSLIGYLGRVWIRFLESFQVF
jgi:hypothetical protein